jgi:hypothetical protein
MGMRLTYVWEVVQQTQHLNNINARSVSNQPQTSSHIENVACKITGTQVQILTVLLLE